MLQDGRILSNDCCKYKQLLGFGLQGFVCKHTAESVHVAPRLPMATSNWGDLCREKGGRSAFIHLVILQE